MTAGKDRIASTSCSSNADVVRSRVIRALVMDSLVRADSAQEIRGKTVGTLLGSQQKLGTSLHQGGRIDAGAEHGTIQDRTRANLPGRLKRSPTILVTPLRSYRQEVTAMMTFNELRKAK